jgi:hypothetical protein
MQNKNVKVRAITSPGGQVEFEVDGVNAKHARLKLEKDSGPHVIDFELHDHSGKDLQFHPRDPLWVGENCPCPPPQGINSNQLSVSGCQPRTLSTVNQNSGEPRELRYQLNFLAADGSQLTCDPIIQNGGGTT